MDTHIYIYIYIYIYTHKGQCRGAARPSGERKGGIRAPLRRLYAQSTY